MQITSIETFVLRCPLPRPFGWSQGWIEERTTCLVRIGTDEGVTGWGEGAGPALIGSFAPLLLGQDPRNRLGIWQRMFNALYNGGVTSGMGGSAISAVDIALWDIAGQVAGQPISDLLGGRIRDRVAVYATGLYYTECEFPDRLLDEARGYVEAGFRGMKTKVGGLSPQKDIERVAALRDAIGPDIYLCVDANQAYNAAAAIRIGKRLAEYDILWFEEPVNARDIDGYLQVKAALPMSIAGGEVLRMRYEFKDFCARPRLRHCPTRHRPRRRHHRDAARGRSGQQLRHPGQPARLGLAGHDRSHAACNRHDPTLPAGTRSTTVCAGARDGVRPHPQRHPPGTMQRAVRSGRRFRHRPHPAGAGDRGGSTCGGSPDGGAGATCVSPVRTVGFEREHRLSRGFDATDLPGFDTWATQARPHGTACCFVYE